MCRETQSEAARPPVTQPLVIMTEYHLPSIFSVESESQLRVEGKGLVSHDYHEVWQDIISGITEALHNI